MAKNYDYKRALKRKSDHSLMKKVGMTVMAAHIMMAPLGQYIEHFSGHTNSENVAYAQSLGNIEIFGNYTANIGEATPTEDGSYYEVPVSYGGTALADVELINDARSLVL